MSEPTKIPDPRDIRFAEGMLWTRLCRACGDCNGGVIGDLATVHHMPPDTAAKPGPCVWCDSLDTAWELVGMSRGGPVLPEEPIP